MALRSGYKGFKKLLPGLKLFRPGTLGIDNDVLIPELNKTFFPRSEQAELGAKNLLPNNAVSTGIFTVNADGTVTANGQPESTASLFLLGSGVAFVPNIYKGMILNGCPTGGSDSTYCINVVTSNDGSTNLDTIRDTGDGITIPDVNYIKVFIRIQASYSVSNKLFKPMLRLASDPDDTYVPYAMTNKELTEKVKDLDTKITSIECDKTAAGTYTLSATVDAQGAVTYEWTAVTP